MPMERLRFSLVQKRMPCFMVVPTLALPTTMLLPALTMERVNTLARLAPSSFLSFQKDQEITSTWKFTTLLRLQSS